MEELFEPEIILMADYCYDHDLALRLIYAEGNGNPFDNLEPICFADFAKKMYDCGQNKVKEYEMKIIPELIKRYESD